MQRSPTQASGRAWGWLAALLDGSVTPWRESTVTAEPRLPFFPAAQQLESLRRLNIAAAASGRRVSPELARALLVDGITDRNRGDLRLVGEDEWPFGPPAVRPSRLPARDLLPVVAGPLARRLAALPERAPRRPLPLVRGVRLDGDPWAVALAEIQQAARGRARTGRRAMVLTDDFATVALRAWGHQAVSGGVLGPQDWMTNRIRSEVPPPALRLAKQAHRVAAEVGVRHTLVVVGPQPVAGLRPTPAFDPVAVDLARWVGRPLGVLVSPERRRHLLLESLVPEATRPTGPLTVPAPWHDRLTAYAERQRSLLRQAGYPVLGSLDGLLPAPASASAFHRDGDVLDRALELLLDPREGVS
ncbi:hypothetical protein GCM10028801_02990 [Nocardioides maradonensis]